MARRARAIGSQPSAARAWEMEQPRRRRGEEEEEEGEEPQPEGIDPVAGYPKLDPRHDDLPYQA